MLKNKLTVNLFNFTLFLNSGILLFPNKLKIYPILLFFSMAIFVYKKTNIKKPFSLQLFFFTSSLFFIYACSCLISFELKSAVYNLSTMSSLLAYPLIFGLIKSAGVTFNEKHIKIVFITFIITTILFCTISFIYFWRQEYTFVNTIIHYSNLVNIGLDDYNIHPIYLSVYIGISCLMLFFLFINNKHFVQKLFIIFALMFLVVILTILMRKGPIIYLLLSIIYYLSIKFRLRNTIIAVFTVFFVIIISLKIIPKYKDINRFDDLFNSTLVNETDSSTAIRSKIYNCVIEKIIESPLLGHGVCNVQNQLNKCYSLKKNGKTYMNYNSHNQYFGILLTFGFFGLIIYFYATYIILKNIKSKIGSVILIFFLLNFLTENLIEREDGMLIYSFFTSFFIYYKSSL